MNANECYNRLLAEQTIQSLGQRNIKGWYFEDRAAALEKALSLIPGGGSASCGGSETLKELGLREGLDAGAYTFIDPLEGKGSGGMDLLAHQALTVDCFFMSANAIAATGEIVNIDGYGNRVAALIFGPKRVVIIAGMNKVTHDFESAMQRAKGIAAAKTVALFKQDYTTFAEMQAAAEMAQSQIVITKRSATPDRIFVILVGENLGF